MLSTALAIHQIETGSPPIVRKPHCTHTNNLYYASGGNLSPFFSTGFSGESSIVADITETDRIENNSLSSTIKSIKSCFNLSMDEVAQLCQTTRKTMYNWINKEREPQQTNLKRLFNLHIISKNWKQHGYTNDTILLKQPIVHGKSVIDLLKSDDIDNNAIMFAGSRLNQSKFDENQTLKNPFLND